MKPVHAVLSCLVFAASAAGLAADTSDADTGAMRKAAAMYATAWLTNDADTVMATFVPEPVLSPSGLDYRVGQDAAREFWFPQDAPPTLVTRFAMRELEADVSGRLGFVRGTFTLAFDYDGNSYENHGKYVSILRQQDDGQWLITHHIWDDFPRAD
jgi:ketosteroid isomerase-like protein